MILKVFGGQIPEINQVVRTAQNISDYNAAHLTMLPSVIRDAGKEEGSIAFYNAKSSFHSILSQVAKMVEKEGGDVDFHVSTAGRQLVLCYYYHPNICHEAQMEVFIKDLEKHGLFAN